MYLILVGIDKHEIVALFRDFQTLFSSRWSFKGAIRVLEGIEGRTDVHLGERVQVEREERAVGVLSVKVGVLEGVDLSMRRKGFGQEGSRVATA